MLFNEYSNCHVEKKKKKIVWGKWYKSSCPPSNGVEKGPTVWCVCWYPTQINQFDRTLVGWKNCEVLKRRFAVPCCEHISGGLLAPAKTHQAEPHQPLRHRHIRSTGPRAVDCVSCAWFGDLFQSLVAHRASDTPRCLPFCPLFSSIRRGCWPSTFITHCSSSMLCLRAGAVW